MTKKGGKKRGVSRTPKSIPVLPLLGVGVGFAQPISNTLGNSSPLNGNVFMEFIRQVGVSALAYDIGTNKFWFNNLFGFYAPIALGTVAHKALNWLGVNRVLTRFKIPITL